MAETDNSMDIQSDAGNLDDGNREIYVNCENDDFGMGTIDNPYKTFKQALDNASDGDTIYIASGIYNSPKQDISLVINKTLTIKALGENVVFDGEYQNSLFTIDKDNVVLDGLTFKNGKNTNGGALYFSNASNTQILNSVFMDNEAGSSGNGGAIYFGPDSQNNTIINSTFRNNVATFFGAVVFWYSSNNKVLDCEFISNSGTYGSAMIFYYSSNNTVMNSTFRNNRATNGNGAINFWACDSTSVINSTFLNNRASGYGGALGFMSFSDRNNIINSTFIGNRASDGGGAIYMGYTSTNYILNSIFINNNAPNSGAMYLFTTDHCVLLNSIILNNTAFAYDSQYLVADYNWWGNTGEDFNVKHNTNMNINNWLFLNSSADKELLDINESSLINISLDNVFYNDDNSIGKYEKYSLPEFNLAIDSVNGKTNQSHVNLVNGSVEINYLAETEGEGLVKVFYDDYGTVIRFNIEIYDPKRIYVLNKTVVAGENIHVSMSNNSTGLISLSIGGRVINSTIINGSALINIPNDLKHGNYSISVSYFENGSLVSQASDYLFVKNIPTIKISNTELFVGDTIEFNLPEDLNTVFLLTILNDTHAITAYKGKAFFNLPYSIGAGSYFVDIYCEANENYISYNESEIIIVKDKPKTDIQILNKTVVAGDNITFLFPAAATGKVDIIIGNETFLGNIVMEKVLINVPEDFSYGYYPVNLTYYGDYNFPETFISDNIFVKNKLEYFIENYTVVAGNNLILNVLNNATGNILINIGNYNLNSTINNSKSIFNIPNRLRYGLYNASISYSGDNNYIPMLNYSDITVKNDITMSIDNNTVTAGKSITVNLPISATGSVVATIARDNMSATIDNGKVSIPIPASIGSGVYSLNVYYLGNDRYVPSSSSFRINVLDRNIVLYAPNVTKYYGGADRFYVYLTDNDGNPYANVTANITLNNRSYLRITNSSGVANMAINLNSGIYSALVTANVAGNTVEDVATITVKSTLAANDIVKTFRNDTQFYVNVLDEEGNIAPNTTVQFNINGIFYNRTTNSDGVAKLNINLNPGKYIITTYNILTGESTSNEVSVLSYFNQNADLVKYYRNDSQYVVRINGLDGNPVGENEVVRFNINGVFYERKTNSSGHVKLNINLNPGDYIITAEYKGLRVSNNVKVLPILSAENLTMHYLDGSKFEAKLLNNVGNPFANQNVIFNINGVFYNRTTDVDGVARLNINLMSGEYIITSSYGGFNIANTISIS